MKTCETCVAHDPAGCRVVGNASLSTTVRYFAIEHLNDRRNGLDKTPAAYRRCMAWVEKKVDEQPPEPSPG